MSVEPDNVNEPTGESEAGEYTRLKRIVRDAHEARSDWRKEATTAYDMVANHQWSEDDLNILREQERPAVSFNRMAPLIKAVCGLEINNRMQVAYLPRTIGDAGVDESRTDMAKWVRDVCDAEDEESEGFKDLLICGEGWVETHMSHDEDVQGRIVEERIDPLEMGVNYGATKMNYKDAKLIYRAREMDSEDAQTLIGEEYAPEVLHAGWLNKEITPADGGQGYKRDYPAETRAGLERQTGRRTKCTIVQVQWWEREPVHLVAVDGEAEMQEMDDEEFAVWESRVNAMKEADLEALEAFNTEAEAYQVIDETTGLGELGIAPRPQPPQPLAPNYSAARVLRRVYYEGFLGQALLGKKKMDIQEFSFKAMTGERDRKMKCFYGMVRDMTDPQRWANKWLSQSMQIMNSNAKGGLMAETDAFVNQRKAEEDWANPQKVVWVKPGALEKGKIQPRVAPPMPQGLDNLITFAVSSLRDVTGVNLELMGQADREQAASLEAQRRQSAMTTLATMFDSLRRFRKEQGRLLLQFIELLPEGTLYSVLDKGQYKYVPFIKNGDIKEYDVIIDQTPTSPDQKRYVWATTERLLGMGLELPMQVIIELLKYSPYPESVVAEISKAMGLGGEENAAQLKEKLAQAEQALQVMTQALEKAGDEQEKEQAEMAIKAYEAETGRLKVRLDAIAQSQALASQPQYAPEQLS